MKQTQNNKGFSLVELIVIIAIIAALVAVVSVSSGTLNRYYAKAATDDIASTLKRCKSENLSGVDCYVQLNNSYVALCNADGSEIDRENFPKSVTIQPKSGTDAKYFTVSFDMSTGSRVEGDSSYTVTYGAFTYTIKINSITGSVEVS